MDKKTTKPPIERICRNCRYAEELDRECFICDLFTDKLKGTVTVYDSNERMAAHKDKDWTKRTVDGEEIDVKKSMVKNGIEVLVHVCPKDDEPREFEINQSGTNIKIKFNPPGDDVAQGDQVRISHTFFVDGEFGCNKFKKS